MMNADSHLLMCLQQHIDRTGLHVSPHQLQQLVVFVQLMDKWNKAYNLTSVRDPEQMLVKHIVDSIVIAPHLQGSEFIDVGTGPGLPGIPLAIMLPQAQFILLDSLGKRVRFMKQAAFELGLSNVTPVQSRVEQFCPDKRLDGVISRAFASLKDMLHWCQHLVDSQGAFFALKGQYPEQELTELSDKFVVTNVMPLNIPGLDGERHLITISKK